MKIIYADDKLKELCKNRFAEMDIEKILKCFSDILGKKITVLDSSFTEIAHILKIKNMDDNTINEINIEILLGNHPMYAPHTINYLVSIKKVNENEVINTYNSFIVNKYCVQKVSIDACNKETGLKIKCSEPYLNAANYTITKDNTKCSFLLNGPEESVMSLLLKIENLTLSNVYNLLKSINEDFVQDITIDLSNKKANESEKLIIKNGNLVLYEKKYLKDNKTIDLVYQNGEVYTKVSQTLKNDYFVTEAVDLSEDIEKVKKLFNN